MAWAGKVLGGLFGGMLGGPVGVGVGAALGHYLADSEGAEKARQLPLHLVQLDWQHHGFGPSGPGVRLTPVWIARGLAGVDCAVRVEAGGARHRVVVTPEAPVEECHLPTVLMPYAGLADPLRVEVRLRAPGLAPEEAWFRVPLPSPVRRLGNSGPARAVMAAVACARAGGRAFDEAALAFVHDRFVEGQPLDAAGEAWFAEWVEVLAEADHLRLAPEKVAARLDRHLGADGREPLLVYLMHGCREAWPGPEGERWASELAAALGVAPERVRALWATVDADPEAAAARREAAALLGVHPDDPVEVIRSAWRRAVRESHPDRARSAPDVAEATARTALLNAAAERLLRGR